MDAKVGDEIVVDGVATGDPKREGEILEVKDGGGVVHYRVRWDDGTDCIYFPSSDARFRRLEGRSGKRSADTPE